MNSKSMMVLLVGMLMPVLMLVAIN